MTGKIPETWFDISDGALLIGEAAVEGRGASAIVLSQLIASDYLPRPDEFEKISPDAWTIDEYTAFGKWALRVVAAPDEKLAEVALTERKIQKFYLLGLCPQVHNFSRKFRFGSLRQFQLLIGAKIDERRERFEDWTLSKYVDYTMNIYREVGRRPSKQDFEDAGNLVDIPGRMQIQRRIGGVRILTELIGFPNFSEWEEPDYTDWALRVIKVNDCQKVTVRLVRALAKQGKGPGHDLILDRFNSWDEFISKVEEKKLLARQPIPIPSHEEFSATLFERFNTSDAILPHNFSTYSYNEQTGFFSHYLLAKQLLGDSTLASTVATCQLNSTDPLTYILVMRDLGFRVKLTKIQKLAAEFGTYYPKSVLPPDNIYLKVA